MADPQIVDIAQIVDDSGRITVSVTDGDLTKEYGFDTAINVSLYSDARAPIDKVNKPELRRGWMGDLASPTPDRKFGSLLWLTKQTRLVPQTTNESINYAQLALNWMVEDAIAKSINVSGSLVPKKGVQLKINITAPSGQTTTHYRNLWEVTGNAK